MAPKKVDPAKQPAVPEAVSQVVEQETPAVTEAPATQKEPSAPKKKAPARKPRRIRRLLMALGALMVCALIGLVVLWCNPDRIFFVNSTSVSAPQALKLCPFALITTQEYALADQVREAGPDQLDELMAQYKFALEIQGEPAELTELVSTEGDFVYVNYERDRYRCILTVHADGSLDKLSCIYDNQGQVQCLMDNQDNLTFTRYRESRMLLSPPDAALEQP